MGMRISFLHSCVRYYQHLTIIYVFRLWQPKKNLLFDAKTIISSYVEHFELLIRCLYISCHLHHVLLCTAHDVIKVHRSVDIIPSTYNIIYIHSSFRIWRGPRRSKRCAAHLNLIFLRYFYFRWWFRTPPPQK